MKDTFSLKPWCLVSAHLQSLYLFFFYRYFFLHCLHCKERDLFHRKSVPGTPWTWSMLEQARKYQVRRVEVFEVRKKSTTARSKPKVYWGTNPLRNLRKILSSGQWGSAGLLLQKSTGIAIFCQPVNPGNSLCWQQWAPLVAGYVCAALVLCRPPIDWSAAPRVRPNIDRIGS